MGIREPRSGPCTGLVVVCGWLEAHLALVALQAFEHSVGTGSADSHFVRNGTGSRVGETRTAKRESQHSFPCYAEFREVLM